MTPPKISRGLSYQTPQGQVRETTPSFTPDLSPAEIAERGALLPTGLPDPTIASLSKWPDEWKDKLLREGWLDWYRAYTSGRRTTDDARQIKRWHSFKARHGAQMRNKPSPRRAYAMINWAIDPMQFIEAAQQKAFKQKMDAYFQQRKKSVKAANFQSLSHLGMNMGLNQGMKLPQMSTKFTQTNPLSKGISNPFKDMPLTPSTAGSGPLTNKGLMNVDGFVRPNQVNFASLSRSTPFGTGKIT